MASYNPAHSETVYFKVKDGEGKKELLELPSFFNEQSTTIKDMLEIQNIPDECSIGKKHQEEKTVIDMTQFKRSDVDKVINQVIADFNASEEDQTIITDKYDDKSFVGTRLSAHDKETLENHELKDLSSLVLITEFLGMGRLSHLYKYMMRCKVINNPIEYAEDAFGKEMMDQVREKLANANSTTPLSR